MDEKLVKLARKGDKDAFIKLYECIYEDLYKTAFYLLRSKEDAEDVVSETVLTMYGSISKLKKAEAFRAWAMKILVTQCKRKQREYYDEIVELEEKHAIANDANTQVVERESIKSALHKLSDDEQSIVVFSAVFEMSSNEIGQLLGIKSTTVRSKLARAYSKLKSDLVIG